MRVTAAEMAAVINQGRENWQEEVWDMMAVAGRYGHQDVDALMSWTAARFYRFVGALVKVMQRESGRGGGLGEAAASGG